MRLASLVLKRYLMLLDLASGRMYTFLALNFNAEAEPFPSSVFSSVAVFNKILCFTQSQYADFPLARSRQSKDQEDARTVCELLDHLVLVTRIIPFARFVLGI